MTARSLLDRGMALVHYLAGDPDARRRTKRALVQGLVTAGAVVVALQQAGVSFSVMGVSSATIVVVIATLTRIMSTEASDRVLEPVSLDRGAGPTHRAPGPPDADGVYDVPPDGGRAEVVVVWIMAAAVILAAGIFLGWA